MCVHYVFLIFYDLFSKLRLFFRAVELISLCTFKLKYLICILVNLQIANTSVSKVHNVVCLPFSFSPPLPARQRRPSDATTAPCPGPCPLRVMCMPHGKTEP